LSIVILIGGGVSEIESYPFELLKSLTLSFIPEAQKVNLIFEKAKFGNKAALIGGLEIAKKLWSNKC
jgi:predicted NBD/HSP70 family sugar kinase